jgi:fumarate reductase flavoprotein subunit
MASLAACTPRSSAPEEEGDQEGETLLTTDIVIVGAGGTGLAAAASAIEHGAEVIVLEKLAFTGGSTALSGGGIAATDTKFQRAEGIEDSKESWMELWKERQATSNPDGMYPDYDFVDMFMDEAVITTEWMADTIGHKYARIEGFGLDPVRRLHFPERGGREVIESLENYLKERGVEILTETPGKELLTNEDGDVIGVVAEGPDGERIVIEAKKVILATGGFARNEDLLARFVPEVKGSSEITAAAAGSTGDGILMAEKVGAALYEEPWIIGLGVGTKVKGTDSLMMDWTKLYVNGEGKRFASEQMHYAIATNKIIEEGDVWIVMDSAEANADLIAAMEEAMPTDEVAKGDTLEELAEAMGVPVENFVATIEEYNQGAKTGKDAMGKDPEFVLPVEKAPFYAIKAHPKTMGTFGGVKTDEFYRVLRADGSVINNLYAGGECANKVLYNQVYMSGSAVQFALTSGRIAGEHAAKNLNN